MTDEERRLYNRDRQRAYRARKTLENPDWNRDYNEKKARQTRRRKYWLGKYKVAKGCSECGYKGHHAALDFDHLDPNQKDHHIAQSIAGRNIKTIMGEVRKCRILCANCHRVHSFNQAKKRIKYV